MLCTLSNDCYLDPNPQRSLLNQGIDAELSVYRPSRWFLDTGLSWNCLHSLTHRLSSHLADLQTVLSDRISDDGATSGSSVARDATAAAIYALSVFNGVTTPQLSVPLATVIDQQKLAGLMKQMNISKSSLPSILAATIQLPSLVCDWLVPLSCLHWFVSSIITIIDRVIWNRCEVIRN